MFDFYAMDNIIAGFSTNEDKKSPRDKK